MAKKRAKGKNKARGKGSDELDTGKAGKASRGPRGPKRRKREHEGLSRKKRGSGRWGKIALVTVIGAVIVLMIGYGVYNRGNIQEGEDSGPVSSVAGQYGAKLRILTADDHDWGVETTREVHFDGKVGFMLMLENKGSSKTKFDITATEPEGWEVKIKDTLTLEKKQNKVLSLQVKAGSDIAVNDTARVTVTVTTEEDATVAASVDAHVKAVDMGEERSEKGDMVEVYYVLVDRGGYDDESGNNIPFDEDTWRINQDGPFETEAGGQGSIPGFSNALIGMRVGETKVYLIPESEAYAGAEGKPQGDLWYEMTCLSFD